MPRTATVPADLAPSLAEPFDLVLNGEKIDGRTQLARRYKTIAGDLMAQLGNAVTPAEKIQLRAAAVLALLIERDTAALLEGQEIDAEGLRRNVTVLGAQLIRLGMAAKSRDITKGNRKAFDAHASAILDADE
ncbi:hypothetical protein [Azospirillum sp. SYSU D00513]|uniref:hypothetical protein n=1 Tax=Azospirillum sp. SYSU D00513 TaxID=2812561 RepID=UPI001A97CAA7|nr:hypothetical protein [Azospirillum sp. SYSU D00513]